MDGIITKEAKVNGVRIHYKIAGRGSPLLLLHGSPLTSRSWLKIIPALAENHTVVAPDLRGYGESDKPETGYELHTMAEDLKQLLHQLGMESVRIVGHDLGGLVAYVYAAQYMDEVLRLGIMEAPIAGVPSPTVQKVLAAYWHIGLYAHPRLPELLITGRERDYLAEFIRTYQFNKDAFDEKDLDEYGRHLASLGGIRGAMGVYRAIVNEIPAILQLTHKTLTMPVWAVGGEHSMGIGPFEQFQHLAQTVRGGVITGSGHWVIEEQPDQILAQLKDFLR
jgi:pimeloyl-ACP methyl ester carboxylesterase